MLPQNPTATTVDDATYRALHGSLARRLGGDNALAADLLQDSLLQFLRKRDTLRDDAAALAFLRTIIARRVADHFRRGPHPTVALAAGGDRAASVPGNDDDATRRLGAYLPSAVALLPEPFRGALEAVDLRGESQRAYAETHDLPYSTAKSRVQRARRLLRAAVTACCEVEADAYGNILSVRPRRCACDSDATT